MKHILLLEDDPDVRQWSEVQLKRAFPEATVLAVESVAGAISALDAEQFDLAILDISLPDGSGIEVAQQITQGNNNTVVVMSTVYDDDLSVFDSLKAGAQGYLLKGRNNAEFTEKLRGILNGEPPLSPAIALKILGHFQKNVPKEKIDPVISNLTKREEQVLMLIAKGMNRPEIAELLGITTNTAAAHVKSIYKKLNIASRAEAATEAGRMGLL